MGLIAFRALYYIISVTWAWLTNRLNRELAHGYESRSNLNIPGSHQAALATNQSIPMVMSPIWFWTFQAYTKLLNNNCQSLWFKHPELTISRLEQNNQKTNTVQYKLLGPPAVFMVPHYLSNVRWFTSYTWLSWWNNTTSERRSDRTNYSRVMGGNHIFPRCELLDPCSLPKFTQSSSIMVIESEYIGHITANKTIGSI